MNKTPRDIKIKPVLNGFIVIVGCQTVVFRDVHQMASELVRYYTNPGNVELEYLATAIYKMNEQLLANSVCADREPVGTCDCERTQAPQVNEIPPPPQGLRR